MTPAAREACFDQIVRRAAAWSVVVVDAPEVDRLGVHRANIAALRRAVLRLAIRPGYVLTDGFPVAGLGAPSLAVWKGDRVAGCIAAASVVAKVTRDRLMVAADTEYPGYGFAVHKGYSTAAHQASLTALGPSPLHRRSFRNVAAVAGGALRDGRG